MKTAETTKCYVYCRNEAKIEEILKWLHGEEIPFEIVGRQALFLPSVDETKLADFLQTSWFEVERRDTLDQFPQHCWEFRKRDTSFINTLPDEFSPVQIPAQEKRR